MNLSSVSPPLAMFPDTLFCWHSHITNWTCCLHSFHVFVISHYFDSDIIIKRQFYLWSSQSKLCKCIWCACTQNSKQGIFSIVSHIWLPKHGKLCKFVYAWIFTCIHTQTLSLSMDFWRAYISSLIFLFVFLFWTVICVVSVSFIFQSNVQASDENFFFFLTDLLWSKFMPFLSL